MKTIKILNMKKLIIFSSIGIGLIVTLLYACTGDFLETMPTGSANNVVLANAKGVDMLLIGAYAGIDGTPTTDGSLLVRFQTGSLADSLLMMLIKDKARRGSTKCCY